MAAFMNPIGSDSPEEISNIVSSCLLPNTKQGYITDIACDFPDPGPMICISLGILKSEIAACNGKRWGG